MALSKKEIEATILVKGFHPIEIDTYKNLDSPIKIKCKNGHVLTTSMKNVRKDKFECPLCIGESSAAFAGNTEVPDKKGYRIVAIDQASYRLGISVYDDGKLVYFGLIEVNGTTSVRMAKIYKYLSEVVVKEWKPDYLVFEDIQYQDNAITHKILGMILGVCILAAELGNVEHQELSNKVWQSEFNIAGSTREAQKSNVIKRVKEYYDINVGDDVADAILIGKYATKRLQDKWELQLF